MQTIFTMIFLSVAAFVIAAGVLPDQRGEAAGEIVVEKLDPSLRYLLETAEESVAAAEGIPVIIQFSGLTGTADLKHLKEIGIQTRSVTGNIVSALVPRASLADLTAMESVIYVEGPGRLTLE